MMEPTGTSADPSQSIPWIRRELPPQIRRLGPNQAAAVLSVFPERVGFRPTYATDFKACSVRGLYWPRELSSVRVLPEGLESLDGSIEGSLSSESEMWEAWLHHTFRDELLFWAPEFQNAGVYRAPFVNKVRHWIKSEFILSPIFASSDDASFFMLFDQQMRYWWAAGEAQHLDEMDQVFGGQARIRRLMSDYIDQFGVGFGEADRDWAREYLMSW